MVNGWYLYQCWPFKPLHFHLTFRLWRQGWPHVVPSAHQRNIHKEHQCIVRNEPCGWFLSGYHTHSHWSQHVKQSGLQRLWKPLKITTTWTLHVWPRIRSTAIALQQPLYHYTTCNVFILPFHFYCKLLWTIFRENAQAELCKKKCG